MISTIHLLIVGDVTGVGYRNWMKRQSDFLGISGWVTNKDRGVVEAVVQGEEKKLLEIIDKCKKGPEVAWVKKVTAQIILKSETYRDFSIIV